MSRRHVGAWSTPSSKGTSRRGKRRGSYSLKNKKVKAERYVQYDEVGLTRTTQKRKPKRKKG